MIGQILLTSSIIGGLGVWLGGIRPYLSRHGGVVITAATWGLSAWADWDQCRELAKAKVDSKAAALSRVFLVTQIGIIAGIVLTFCGI